MELRTVMLKFGVFERKAEKALLLFAFRLSLGLAIKAVGVVRT